MLILARNKIRNNSLTLIGVDDVEFIVRPLVIPMPFAWVFLHLLNAKFTYPALRSNGLTLLKQVLKFIVQERRNCKKCHFVRDNFIFIYPKFPKEIPHDFMPHLRSTDEIWVARQPLARGLSRQIFDREKENSILHRCTDFGIFIFWQYDRSISMGVRRASVFPNWPDIRKVQMDPVSSHSGRIFEEIREGLLVNGSYVIAENRFIQIAPYESGNFDCLPQRDIYFLDDSYYADLSITHRSSRKTVFFGTSPNWYHFLVEVLPRLLTFFEVNAFSYDIAINGNVPRQIVEVLKAINGRHPTLIADGEGVVFESLTLCRDNLYQKQVSVDSKSENIFQDRILDLARVQSWVKQLNLFPQTKLPTHLYLSRGNSFSRKIHNHRELRQLIEIFGFEEILCQNLSFFEQVELMRGARFVIVEAGAAAVNILFCENIECIIVIDREGERNFSKFWVDFAKCLDIQVITINGTKMDGRISDSEDFIVNLEVFKSVLLKLFMQ